MAFEGLHPCAAGIGRLTAVVDELAVAAVADRCFTAAVPEVAAGRTSDRRRAFRRIREPPRRLLGVLAAPAIDQRPDLFDVIGGVGGHAPFVAVGAYLAVNIEIVQEHELPGQRVVIRGNALGKNAQPRLAVALRNIAENLVVGAVFLDDVDAVFDRARLAKLARDRIARLRRATGWTAVGVEPDNTRRRSWSARPSGLARACG